MKKLHAWLREQPGRTRLLAQSLQLSQPFVTQMASGAKSIPIEHMAAIEAFTGGEVTRQDMHPTGWHRIWPELAANSQEKTHPPLDRQADGAIADGVV